MRSLLCVGNFPANTGYAWDFIESLYVGIADHLATKGIKTFVAYPAIPEAPRTLEGSAAQPVCLDILLSSPAARRATLENLIRCLGIPVAAH